MRTRRENLAWAAGFFDGEGSVHVCWSYRRKDGSFLAYPQVSISQSGPLGGRILRRWARAVGIPAKVYGPRSPARHQCQVRWLYEASGRDKTQRIYRALEPWLSPVKLAKFRLVLRLSRKRPRR